MSVQPIHDLVAHLTGGARSPDHDLLLSWLAYPLQHPTGRLTKALVLHGPQGNGQGTLLETMARIHGSAYLSLGSAQRLLDSGNAVLAGKRLVVFDKAPQGEATHDALAQLLDSLTLHITRKGHAPRTEPNRLNLLFACRDKSTQGWSPARFLTIETAPPREPEFYRALINWRATEGHVEFAQYLLQYPISAAFLASCTLAEGAAAAMPEAAPIRTATLAEVLDRASATIWDAERTLDRLSEGSPLWNHWYGRMCGLYTLLQCCGALPVGPFGRSAHELQGLLKAARPQLPGGFETYPVFEAHQWLMEHGIQASADEVPHLQRHLVAGLIKQKQVVEPATGGVHHELLAVNADLQNSANPHSTSVGRSPQGETTAHGDQPWN